MFNIYDAKRLDKVYHYALSKKEGKGRILIDVYEIIKGDSNSGKCIAIPNLILKTAKKEYWGKGETKEEALQHCIDLLQNTSRDLIFEND